MPRKDNLMQAKFITVKTDFGVRIKLDIHIPKLKVQLERSAANVIKSIHGASARLLEKHVTSVIKYHILHQCAKQEVYMRSQTFGSINQQQASYRISLRCQRMLMRLMRFRVTATYVPGKNMVVADTLSRCPRKLLEEDDELQQNVKAFVEETVSAWPVSDKKLEQIKQLTQEDVALSTALSYTRDG
ncbi:Pol polyprotein [Elysia marginata]|uniref:Pol polyprotein n=1 Tax=Elysia marginata TaxID=1093978 RepID=A0AAV4FU65_9GAST|nr:Pol polyprotein [Elysia marginata]